MKDLRAQIKNYYSQQYYSNKCYTSSGEPCGPDRCPLEDGKTLRAPSMPAIGPLYGKRRRIVLVGMNPNFKASDEVDDQAEAIAWFERYFYKDNPGDWAWRAFRKGLHRMASIALGDEPGEEPYDCPWVAWTNIIKCASTDKRSKPSYAMWLHCAPKIWGELEILEPDLIITLGAQVHEALTTGAAHRTQNVRVPVYPFSEFWSEIDVASRPVPVFCGFHPSDLRTVNTAWSRIRSGKRPKNTRINEILKELVGSDKVTRWAKEIKSTSSGVENPLVEYIERMSISPDAPPPKYREST